MYRCLVLLWALPCLAQSLESRLLEQLQSAEPTARQAAVEALAEVQPPAALDALLRACDDPSPRVRCALAATLARWQPDAPRAHDALAGLLADPDPRVLRNVCWQLRSRPEAVARHMPRVRALLARQGLFACAAPLLPAEALRAEVPRLLAALRGDAAERAAAVRCFVSLEEGAAWADSWLPLLDDGVGEVREAVWQAVCRHGPAVSLPARLRGLADEHAGARLAALQGLRWEDCQHALLRAAVARLLADPVCGARARRLLRPLGGWGILRRVTTVRGAP